MTHSRCDSDFHFELLCPCSEEEHLHQQAELLYVLHGPAEVRLEGKPRSLKGEDLLLINPNRRHKVTLEEHALACRLTIPYELLQRYIDREHILFWCDTTLDSSEHCDTLRLLLRQMLNLLLANPDGGPDLMLTSCFYELLHCLKEQFLVHHTDARLQQEEGRFDERMSEIVIYMEEHYGEHISLNDLASHLHLTYSYLSRQFKKMFGMNFLEYLNQIRLRHATEDLLYTDHPVTRIALDNGYMNVSGLNKAFKETHSMSPSAFKKQMCTAQEQETAHRIAIQEAAYRSARDYLRQTGVEARQIFQVRRYAIQADGAVKLPFRKNWQEVINIGRASDLLKAKMQEQVLYLRDRLGFSSVRFWDLFDADMELRFGHDTDNLNFDRLDEVLDFLVYNGLTPWIELGDKPLIISTTTTDNVRRIDGEPVFLVLSEYRSVLGRLIHHIITRYRAERVQTWRFECFDDLRTHRQQEPVTYFEIFNITCEVIRGILPHAVIGGCGMKISDRNMEHFLREWTKQSFQPDFFSVMSYPYEEGEVSNGTDLYTLQSRDTRYLQRYASKSRELLHNAGLDIPLYVTEWNCTISSRNYLNDTCFKGTWLLKNIIENLNTVDLMAYWAGSDLIATWYDSRNILNGCPGLLTKDGICKSAYYAFRFLHRMGAYLVDAGENYLITTSGHFSYYIICLNHHPLHERYYQKQENEHSVRDILALSQQNPSIRMAFTFDNLPEDCYTIKTSVISPHYGSVLDEWVRLNTMTNCRQEDIDYLKRICTPHMSIQELDTRQGVLHFEIELEAEQFSLIHIYHKL